MPKLVVLNRTLTAMAHELGEKWVTIGRHDGNVFQIGDASVSGRHCEVRLRGDELIVRDLQSTNGTFVNNQRVDSSELRPGDLLRLGNSEFLVKPQGEDKSSSPTHGR